MPCALAGRVVSATSVAPPAASCTASGSATWELYWMLSPCDPRHRPATQEFIALASMGDPAAVNAAFLNEQTFGVGAKLSGTTNPVSPEAGVIGRAEVKLADREEAVLRMVRAVGRAGQHVAALRRHHHQRAGVVLVAAEELVLHRGVDQDVGLAGAVRGGGRVRGVHRAERAGPAGDTAVGGAVAVRGTGRVGAHTFGDHHRVQGGTRAVR